MTEWEYLVINSGGLAGEQEEELNELGAEGWELVAVAWVGPMHCRLYFKRPKY